MGMAAILVMWPGPFEQTFVSASHRGVVSDENLFLKSVWTTEAYLYYKLTSEASAQVSYKNWGTS